MPIIKTVGIFSKPNSPQPPELVPEAARLAATARGIAVRLDEQTAVYAGGERRACRAPMCPKAATWSSCWAATARCFPPRAPSAGARSRCSR